MIFYEKKTKCPKNTVPKVTVNRKNKNVQNVKKCALLHNLTKTFGNKTKGVKLFSTVVLVNPKTFVRKCSHGQKLWAREVKKTYFLTLWRKFSKTGPAISYHPRLNLNQPFSSVSAKAC